MKREVKLNLHNRFDIVKNGEWVGLAENIILDQMYTRLCNFSTYFVNIHFGTGSGTPTPERTSLFTHLGTKAVVVEEKVKALPTSSYTCKITLNPEEYVGSTITEVGIAYGSSSNYLETHAMIKDAEGNPLSIEKTDLDLIEIYATIFITFSTGSATFVKDIPNNTLIKYFLAETTSISNGIKVGRSAVDSARDINDLILEKTGSRSTDVANRKVINTTRFGVSEGNGTVNEIAWNNIMKVIVPDSMPSGEAKTNVIVGSGDGSTLDFLLPDKDISSLTVKVDGVVTTDYTTENVLGYKDFIYVKDIPTTISYAAGSVSSDGNLVAITDRETLFVYDWKTGSLVYQFSILEEVLATSRCPIEAYFSPQCDYLVVTPGNTGNNIIANALLFKIENTGGLYTFTYIGKTKMKSQNYVDDLIWVSDNRLLQLSNSSPYVHLYSVDDNGFTLLGERADGTYFAGLPGFNYYHVCADDNYIYMCGNGSLVYVLDRLDPTYPVITSMTTSASSIYALFPVNGYLVIKGASGTPKLFLYKMVGNALTEYDVIADGGRSLYGNMSNKVVAMPYYTQDTLGLTEVVDDKLHVRVLETLVTSVPSLAQTRDIMIGDEQWFSFRGYTNDYDPRVHLYRLSPNIQKVRFNSAPAEGVVVTADYTVPYVPKDSNHVLDVTFELQLGEGV